MYQRCKICVIDNASDSSIRFDENGYCNYCRDTLKRRPFEYLPNEKGRVLLYEKVASIKEECKDDPYDCLVGISGGIDSSYIIYLGYKLGLRMLAIHVDDGLDNPIAVENIRKLIGASGADLISIKPNRDEYADVLHSLFKASVPNLAVSQDNLILASLQEYGEKHHLGIRWMAQISLMSVFLNGVIVK